MAAFFVVRDPAPERRRRGMQAAEAAMRSFDVEIASAERGDIGLVWGAFAGAPLDRAPGAFLLGEAIPGPGPERLSAAQYAVRVAVTGTPPACDGYYAAVTFGDDGALTVAADPLGTFPIYVAEAGTALLVASSPALITGYPGFTAAPDPLGLAALLIANGPVRGRTPYRGIRRLALGHVLVAARSQAPREVRTYSLTPHRESHDVPAAECALRVHESFVAAARRHVPVGEPHTMLLSGGLDSRIVLGVLARQGVPLNVITRGRRDDLEYRCARAVARRLGLEQRLVPHGHGSFRAFEHRIRWDGMACTPGTGADAGERLPGAHRFLASGYLADPFFGGLTITKSFDRVSRTASFEHYLARTNSWGVPLDLLPRLLRSDVFGDAVPEIEAQLREDYTGAGGDHLARSWLHTMELRQRVGIGHVFSHLAFGGWPRNPQLDRDVLHTVAGVPLGLLAERRLEYDMLKRCHPDLARLPLDRNDFDVTPPLPGAMDLVRAGLDRRIRRWRARLGVPRPERRYYHRTYDFNGPAWRTARRGAEADRERAYALFERQAFDALVPRAAERWAPARSIEAAAAVKMLTCIPVWLRAAFG